MQAFFMCVVLCKALDTSQYDTGKYFLSFIHQQSSFYFYVCDSRATNSKKCMVIVYVSEKLSIFKYLATVCQSKTALTSTTDLTNYHSLQSLNNLQTNTYIHINNRILYNIEQNLRYKAHYHWSNNIYFKIMHSCVISQIFYKNEQKGIVLNYLVCLCSRLLLQLNVDVNAKDVDNWTPLHAAAHWGQTEACEVLADNGADFNARNKGVSQTV